MTKTQSAPPASPPKAPPPPPVPSAGPAETRPAAPRRKRKPLGRWWFEARDAVGRGVHELGELLGSPRASRRLHEFTDLVASAREPVEVESALVRTAFELSGACRVELVLDPPEDEGLDQPDAAGDGPRLIALAPETAAPMTADELEALGYPLCLGLWCGDQCRMTLQLYAQPGQRRWSSRQVRRLTTLCSIAAAAERGLHAGRRSRVDEERPSTKATAAASTSGSAPASVRDATFLSAVLPYALAQAQRHREPLTVFCVEIDDAAALSRALGPEAVSQASRRVTQAIAETLRGSDVVVKLDDDRVVVMLPNTGGENALIVAEVVRDAVASACQPARTSEETPALTASIGIASFPQDGREMLELLSEADEAIARARTNGPNQVARAGAADDPSPLAMAALPDQPPVADAVVDPEPDVIPLPRRANPRRRPASR